MAENRISGANVTDFTNTETLYTVDKQDTDGSEHQKETTYCNSNWTQQFGYYKSVPELQVAIDAKATWTVGKGFKADPTTTFHLQSIRGFGKDTFNTIIENMIRTYNIAGDSFAEIIRNKEGLIINLKPLNAGSITIVANKQGIIKRYEQTVKIKGNRRRFKKEDIFHLSRNRVSDEIHGVSLIDAVEDIILMRNEAMADFRIVMRRNVSPVRIWHVDTDDTTEIAAFETKVHNMHKGKENIIIPKGVVEVEQASVAPNSTLNPLPWINQLNSYFFQATGVPQIIVGGSQEITEATAKIAYLAFEQTIKEEQLYIEEQCGMQLGYTINLEFPASLENELLAAKAKEETTQANTPEDTTVKGVGLNGTR